MTYRVIECPLCGEEAGIVSNIDGNKADCENPQ